MCLHVCVVATLHMNQYIIYTVLGDMLAQLEG